MGLLCPAHSLALRSTVIALDLNEKGKHHLLKDGGWLKMVLGLQRQADLGNLPVLKVLFGCGCGYCSTTTGNEALRPDVRKHIPPPRSQEPEHENDDFPREWLMYMHFPEIQAAQRQRERVLRQHEMMRREQEQLARDREIWNVRQMELLQLQERPMSDYEMLRREAHSVRFCGR